MSATMPPGNPAPGYGEQPYDASRGFQPPYGTPPQGQPYQQQYAYQPYGQQPGYPPPPGYGQQAGYQQQAVYGQQPGHGQPYGAPVVADPTDVVGSRVGQYLLDALLVAVPIWILDAVLTMVMVSSISEDGTPSAGVALLFPLLVLVALGAGWGVMAWWPSTHDGQTPAMGWLKLRIVNEDGSGAPTLGQLTLRWLLLIVDGLFVGLVGFLIMNSSPRHQRLGDKVGKTVVVRA